MKRRSHLAVTLVALLAVGTSIVITDGRGPALAADPIAEAKARQEQLQKTLRDQEAQLRELRAAAPQLSSSQQVGEAEQAEHTADYERVVGLLEQVKGQIASIKARIAELREQIAALDAQLTVLADEIAVQTEELRAREVLLEDHLRTAYEQSQTSILEMLLSAESLESASNQVG
jgi:peptidoglycan hydrolase CwlO-like protein